jgi:hypothetical protein
MDKFGARNEELADTDQRPAMLENVNRICYTVCPT